MAAITVGVGVGRRACGTREPSAELFGESEWWEILQTSTDPRPATLPSLAQTRTSRLGRPAPDCCRHGGLSKIRVPVRPGSKVHSRARECTAHLVAGGDRGCYSS